jgi:hypothetical protein
VLTNNVLFHRGFVVLIKSFYSLSMSLKAISSICNFLNKIWEK